MTASSPSEPTCTAGTETLTLTQQEAHLVRLLRTCHAHRTASTDDLNDFLRADALTRFVVELLDGYTMEFIQSVFNEANQVIQSTTVFTTAALAYQEQRESVNRFHNNFAAHSQAHGRHNSTLPVAHV